MRGIGDCCLFSNVVGSEDSERFKSQLELIYHTKSKASSCMEMLEILLFAQILRTTDEVHYTAFSDPQSQAK